MTKKNNAGKADSTGRHKKKHKEMFNELETLEEEKINQQRNRSQGAQHRYNETIMEEEESDEVQAREQGGSVDNMCETINRLFAKNVANPFMLENHSQECIRRADHRPGEDELISGHWLKLICLEETIFNLVERL